MTFKEEMRKKYGITDIELRLRELIKFEDYVKDNYDQIYDEAWSSIINGEEDEN